MHEHNVPREIPPTRQQDVVAILAPGMSETPPFRENSDTRVNVEIQGNLFEGACMSISRLRKNGKHIFPHPRRTEIIQLLVSGLARMADGERGPEGPQDPDRKSTEEC